MPIDQDRFDLAINALGKLDDAELAALQFTMPWQMPEQGNSSDDPDFGKVGSSSGRERLQQACWDKFNDSPQVSTAITGRAGRLTGMGFEISSEIMDIQDAIEETELDPRNRLYTYWPKYVARAFIEGELLHCFTVHTDGFIEVDFIDPSNVNGGGEDGVIYHPNKSTMPLFYFVQRTVGRLTKTELIPSIFVARYPELYNLAKDMPDFQEGLLAASKSKKAAYKSVGGFTRFIVSWDRSFVTKRNVSHLRTILQWLNHYETLKKYEIDHKKSAGSYLWVVTMEDPKVFRTWLAMSDEDKAKTGILAKKTPGGTLIMPPGMKVECKNPTLPSISETDTDIFHMITSGLNEPEDVTSGQSKGTFASVKASRGPMSDRISDEMSAFEKYLRHDFYGAVFFLKNKVNRFPALFTQKVAVDFKGQKPVFKNIKRRPELLIEISFPVSDVSDLESTSKALLGVKHGSTYEVLGIPNEQISKKMGFGNYRKMRLLHATEMEKYPELAMSVDQASVDGNAGNAGANNTAGSKNEDAVPKTKPTLKKRVIPQK